jgi:hypothetical protein
MKRYIFLSLLFLLALLLFAQDGMYLIPQTMYVGDRGTLVLPLGAAYAEMDPIIITESHLLPLAPDIVISRMEIETRTGVPRLLVDFRSYVPGLVELPVLNLGGYQFTGLKVQVTSILEADGDRVLSAAASPLSVPGTLTLIYGSIIAIVLILLIALIFAFRGLPYMKLLMMGRQRRFVLRILKRSIQKMRNAVTKNTLPGNEVLIKVSQELRKFLSFFTKCNCFTMVPKEFLQLPKLMNTSELKGGEFYIVKHVEIVYCIFKRCDDLRFSGNDYGKESILQVLDSISSFAAGFESSEKEKLSYKKQLPASSEASL